MLTHSFLDGLASRDVCQGTDPQRSQASDPNQVDWKNSLFSPTVSHTVAVPTRPAGARGHARMHVSEG